MDDARDFSFIFQRMIGPDDVFRQTMVQLAGWNSDEIYMETAHSYVW